MIDLYYRFGSSSYVFYGSKFVSIEHSGIQSMFDEGKEIGENPHLEV